jgi:c-di-GMP-binding flagellar brake protein YcgR
MHRQQPIEKKKVYLNRNKEGYVSCSRCGKAQKISARDSGSLVAQGLTCSCSNVTDVHLEQRQHFRKDVEFIGTFKRIHPDTSEMGKITIEDISHTGMRFKTVTRNHLKKDDIIHIRFALKDSHDSIIAENGVVRFVKGPYVGIEFQHLSEHSKKLIGFYLMQFATAPVTGSNQKIIEPSNRRYLSDSQLVLNPFGTAIGEIPVSLKGDLNSFGFYTVLKTLSIEKKSGVVLLSRGRARRALCLKEGNVIAASGSSMFRLGQIILDLGIISREKLEDALYKAMKCGKRLGVVLLEEGYISEGILKGLIQHQIQKVVNGLSRWKEGRFEYHECSVEFNDQGITDSNVESVEHAANKTRLVEQRREHSRVEVSWPMSIFTPRGPIEGRVLNISLTGAFIRCLELPNPVEALKLGIEIWEHRHVMFATAEMVRLDVRDYDSDLHTYFLGVRFKEIAEEDLRFLASKFLH